ncbi:MAG: OsmC family protein [Flammeovirgaceae bacterium]|nr:OsmC family protein [Flammeovirgaceae bacterium]
MKQHIYKSTVAWTGNRGTGTSEYKAYDRDHVISTDGKPEILCSSDPSFRGDVSRYSPEDLLVSSLSSCHMLWYLHLCAVNGVIVLAYVDHASGIMIEHKDGSGEFTEVTLYPVVKVKDVSMKEKANQLHQDAHKMCFIARSVNFPVKHNPVVTI